MGHEPKRKTLSPRTKGLNPKIEPNFALVGSAYRTPTDLLDLLLYSEVQRHGKNRWYVRARFEEWVRSPGHEVHINHTGRLVCDCRQGMSLRRECAHVVAVRHLATTTAKPVIAEQIRLFPEPPTPVRIVTPSVNGGSSRG